MSDIAHVARAWCETEGGGVHWEHMTEKYGPEEGERYKARAYREAEKFLAMLSAATEGAYP